MTLVLKLDLDMVNMFHYTKNEASMSMHPKVIACTTDSQPAMQTDGQTGRQTDRQTHNMKTLPSHMPGR